MKISFFGEHGFLTVLKIHQHHGKTSCKKVDMNYEVISDISIGGHKSVNR